MKYPKAKSFHSPIHPCVRILSLILSLLCFFSFVPPLSFAQESTQTKEAAASDLTLDTEEALTYTELVERRDRFTKHFKRSDGKFVAIVYPEAIHTAENGVMVNLDNRLTKRASGRYENEGQGFLASFAPSISDTEPIRLSFEGYTLSWRVDIVRKERVEEKWQGVLSDATQASAAISPTVEAPRAASVGTVKSVAIADADERASFTEEEIKSTFMASSGMTYSQAFSGNGTVDLVYSLSDNKLEEDILVWDRGNIHSYVLTMNADGMTAVLNEDRSVTFVDAGDKDVFTISSPWMHDATYAFSDAINVSLAQKGNEVTVVYTPDAEWMTAKERVYPILIDPSVRSRNYTANYQDTFTYPTNTGDRSAITYMRVGKGNEAFFKLLHYPMALDAVNIESATLNFWGSANSTNLRMRVLTTPWDQSTLTYDNRPLGLSTVYTSTTATASTSTGWRVFNLMPAIQEYTYYHAGQSGFFNDYLEGFRIYHDSTTTQYLLISSESTDVQTRPYIEITYSYEYDNPIANYGIYMIKNAASGRSLMNTASSTNVYQYSSAYSQGQAYRARGGNGVYTFESLNRAGEALTYDYSGSNTQNTANVYTATLSESLADSQDFMLQYVTDSSQGYQLYAIVSRADTTMALTALGTTNGSPTGAGVSTTGNVVMSTYTGSTNQLWYFESGGQPVFVGNNIVAMNGDTLQYNYGVTESMIQPYGYITAYGERITWSSDNTDAITIAANGKVTINGAGKAVLTATVKNSSGTRSREYSYTVIISLGNGLYRIKNKATGLYLGVDGNQYLNYDDVVMTEKITSGIEQYNQLWKIYHIGNGVYSIRLLPKLNMGLDVTDSTVDIYSIGMTDTVSGVPSYGEWDFEWKGSNDYLLRHKGLTSSVVTASTNGVTVSSNDNSNTQLWQFEEVEFDSGLVLFDTPSWLAPKESGSVRSSVYSYYLMDQGVTLTSDNEAVARISSGNIIGVSEGVATITVTSNVVASWSKSFTVSVTPFENGIYIFENKETKKAIQPDDNGDFHIEQFEFDSEWYQFWGFERHVDQYYRIINKENGLCLTSPVSTESELELSLEAWNEAIQSRQLWKITELSDQSFVLQSQLMETASLVMSVGGGLNVNGINIVQKEFTSNSDYSEQWIIKNTNVELYVPYFAQWTTKWCWVTSAQMMVRAMYPSAANYGDEAAILEEQRRAVYHVYGDPSIAYEDYDWDNDENLQELNKQTGDYISVGKAAAFLAGMVDADVTYSAYLTPYSQEGLVGFLVNGYAVCCLRGTLKIPYPVTNDNLEETLTNNSENLFSGHVIVVTGCRWDSDEGQYIFTINDPWTYQEDQNGNQINIYESEVDIEENKYEMSYGDLIFENEMKETYFSATLWFPTVVTKTDFSGKTILEEVLEFEYDS